MNNINSHYIQKALLKNIFGKNEEIFIYKNKKVQKANFDQVASMKGLFNLSTSAAKELEKTMNEKLEQRVFSIIQKISESNGSIELKDYEVLDIRKYFLITFYRLIILNSKREDIDQENFIETLIKLNSESTYTDRKIGFEIDELGSFFIKNSNIKFLRHKDVDVVLTSNFFHSIPLDLNGKKSLEMDLYEKFGRYITLVVPISKNTSIVFVNNDFVDFYIKQALEKRAVNLKLNVNNYLPYMINSTKTTYKGKTWDSMQYHVIGEEIDPIIKEYWEHGIHSKAQATFTYKIHDWSDDDFDLQFLDNFSKLVSFVELDSLMRDFIFKKDSLKKMFIHWINITEFVENNQPSNVEYWSSNNELKYLHKIWELNQNSTIEQLKNIVLNL